MGRSSVLNSSNMASKPTGCFGNSTCPLDNAKLNTITDSIHKTLDDPCGKCLLRAFLVTSSDKENIECLKLYEMAKKALSEKDLKQLVEKCNEVYNAAMGRTPITAEVMNLLHKAIKERDEEGLKKALKRTQQCCVEYLDETCFEKFKKYIIGNLPKACPLQRVP